jgi:hypothetical protein
MEQNKTDQILEVLLARMEADRAELMAKMETNQEKMDAMQATMDSQLEETMAWLGETKASSVTTESCEGKTHACPLKTEAKREPTTEEREAVAEPQEVPEGATGEEMIGATEDQSRDLHLATGCCGQLKACTKHDGRMRQEYAAAIGRPTRRTVPAMRKGHVRRGPGKKCRCGLKGQNKAFQIGKRK